ncbi:MAG: 30S ribosomal protein S27ae [Candidatus Marsarchaeota archaeon]|nr:30S ribosomal protein S27ae [Candidatus Marsarchaeota archaeon]MCL5413256.1 30S ribosomal protein S27ae [Candidatus Marsarchaeota archaeon]
MADDKKKPVKKYTPVEKFCTKCGARMASHADRYACGRCSYTEWKAQKGK